MSDMPKDAARPRPAAAPLLEATDIRKDFVGGKHHLQVLDGVNLSLAQGELVAIVGSSGTGKTTLLHILGTLERPATGSLLLQGEDVFARDDKDLSAFRNRTIGFVFQFHHLLPEFTALENVMMPGLIAEREKKALSDEAMDLLAKVGLAGRLYHKVGELSGGEQQRVALARAIIMKPALLLADEPTGNLDTKTGLKVFDLIGEMNAAFALTTVMVTHNHDLARRMDRCLTLADGKLHHGL